MFVERCARPAAFGDGVATAVMLLFAVPVFLYGYVALAWEGTREPRPRGVGLLSVSLIVLAAATAARVIQAWMFG
jgi:hypothetical protein